jgi:hypothetical protein
MPHRCALVAAFLAFAGCYPDDAPADSAAPEGSWFPFLAVRPDAVEFDTVTLGTVADATLVMANVGPGTLALDDVALVGADASLTTDWAGPATVAPGESVEVGVRWSPDSVQALQHVLRIVSNDPVAPQLDVPVAGTTTFPDIELTPPTWDFGTVDVGKTSVMGVTIGNAGTSPLTVTSVDYVASDGDLTIDDVTVPFVVAPKDSVDVRVSYRPTGDGVDSGALTVVSDDPDEPEVVAEQVGTGRKGFVLLATETPSGAPAVGWWGGIFQFRVAASGAPFEPIPGLDASEVHDPWGLAWRAASGEVFVGNRHGNTAADGVAGSVQRFLYDPYARTLTPNGGVTGNDLDAVHQVGFDPVTGELFAANLGGGLSRFVFDAGGEMVANGTLTAGRGSMRGVAVADSGATVWASTADRFVRPIDLATGSQLPFVTTAVGAVVHNLAVHDGQLYAGGVSSNAIHRFDIGPDDGLTLVESIGATFPIAVAFSPDGLEMYSSGHDRSVIERFAYDEIGDTWTYVETFDVGTSIGSLLVIE